MEGDDGVSTEFDAFATELTAISQALKTLGLREAAGVVWAAKCLLVDYRSELKRQQEVT